MVLVNQVHATVPKTAKRWWTWRERPRDARRTFRRLGRHELQRVSRAQDLRIAIFSKMMGCRQVSLEMEYPMFNLLVNKVFIP